jgi:hypothetical protein
MCRLHALSGARVSEVRSTRSTTLCEQLGVGVCHPPKPMSSASIPPAVRQRRQCSLRQPTKGHQSVSTQLAAQQLPLPTHERCVLCTMWSLKKQHCGRLWLAAAPHLVRACADSRAT